MIQRRRSKLHGWGVFATARIPKNKRIIHYAGEKITHRESARREAAYMKDGRIWCFHLNSRWVIDAGVGGNAARYINHACEPNCETIIEDRRVFIRALRTIQPGEELSYDYQIQREPGDPPEIDEIFACRCGAAGCRGTMLLPPRRPRRKQAGGRPAKPEHHAHGRSANRH